MKWIMGTCVCLSVLGCSGAHEQLVQPPQEGLQGGFAASSSVEAAGASELASAPDESVPAIEQKIQEYVEAAKRLLNEGDLKEAASLLEQAAALDPLVEQARKTQQQLAESLKAAEQMLKAGDLMNAATLLDEAASLDPASKSVRDLQTRLREAQRRSAEEARRTLIDSYQREGLKILADGDVERALGYFEAAQTLDPTNRAAFQLIQRAHETDYKRKTKERERQFNERLRLAKVTSQGPLQELASAEDLVARAAAIAGTAAEPAMAAEPGAVQQPQAEPQTASRPEPQAATEYTVQPEDVLAMTVFEEPDLATKARVTSAGEITFPLIGRVTVAGLTVPQVQERLTELLAKEHLVDPQVQVFIEAYHARNVFVTGAVNKPGSYPIPTEKPTTLMEAIAMAGGFSEVAAPNGTRIVRIDQGQEKAIRIQAGDIVNKGDKSKDVVVLPNDIIFVPESFF